MHKIPFFISNLVSCFIYGKKNRHKWRGKINVFLFYPKIARFIRRVYGIKKIKTIHFVRQITLNRVVCVVNDKYYVKIFRNVSVEQLKNFEFLLNYVADRLDVVVPRIYADDSVPMYVCEAVAGMDVYDFDKDFVLKNEDKILNQVTNIICQLQAIDVDDIPENNRFMDSMQVRTKEKTPKKRRRVLAHFDLNETNLLFDSDLNIVAVIDWDTLSIAQNPDTDMTIFMKYWDRYKKKNKK